MKSWIQVGSILLILCASLSFAEDNDVEEASDSDIIQRLPEEIWQHIFSFLPKKELVLNVSYLNSKLNKSVDFYFDPLLMKYGLEAMQNKKYGKARKIFVKAHRLTPLTPEALFKILNTFGEKEKKSDQEIQEFFDPEMVSVFKSSFDTGAPLAKNNWAYLHLQGLGVSLDIEKAFQLFKEAAFEGNEEAAYNWASATLLYQDGSLIDFEEVEQRLEEMASKGNANSLVLLGVIYEKNWERQNLKKAQESYEKAASKGNVYAQETLKRLILDNPKQ
jgi:TPR repeat protein